MVQLRRRMMRAKALTSTPMKMMLLLMLPVAIASAYGASDADDFIGATDGARLNDVEVDKMRSIQSCVDSVTDNSIGFV